MSTNYFIGTIGEGFITHEDQEVNGLSFQCYPADVVAVTGVIGNISNWATRTNAIVKTKIEAQALIDAAIEAVPIMNDPITGNPQAKIQITL